MMKYYFRIVFSCVILSSGSLNAQEAKIFVGSEVLHEKPSIGYNMTYTRRGQLLVNEQGELNQDRLAALLEINPEWLRFPGGTIANTYDWKKAVGPQESRTDQVHGWVSRLNAESSVYGPDEAGKAAEAIGAELMMVTSWNSSAQDVADLVEYMNSINDGSNPNGGVDWASKRAENGHPEPYAVHFWEVGNEGGGSDIATWTSWPYDADNMPEDGVNQGSVEAREWWVNGGDKSFTNQKAVVISSWSDSDIVLRGEASEVRYAKFPPVKEEGLEVKIGSSKDDAIAWVQVENFEESGSDDLHYTIDNLTGKILFGDGVNGKIPTSGDFVFLNYISGPHPGSKGFIAAMKAVDPTIDVAVAHWAMNQESRSDETFEYDGFQAHGGFFLRSNNPLTTNPLDEAVARGLGTMGYLVEKEENDLSGLPEVGLYFSEYTINANYNFDGVNHAYTISGAIMHGLSLAVACMSDRMTLVGPNYVFNNFQREETHIDDSNVILSKGLAQSLFTNHFGSLLVATSQEGIASREIDFWASSGSKGTVDAPLLYSISSVNESGTKNYTMVFNTTGTDTLTASVVFPEYIGEITKHVLGSSSFTDRNWAFDENAISITEQTIERIDGKEVRDVFPAASITVYETTYSETPQFVLSAPPQNGYSVYPNPASKMLYVDGVNEANPEVDFRIYSCVGKLIRSGKLIGNSINIESINKGVYYLTLESPQSKKTLTFIKRDL